MLVLYICAVVIRFNPTGVGFHLVACSSELATGGGGGDHYNKVNSEALVRERTIPTEQPPLVGKVSANVYG
jgi:hypothetical protein